MTQYIKLGQNVYLENNLGQRQIYVTFSTNQVTWSKILIKSQNYRDNIYDKSLIKLGQNIYLDNIKAKFKSESDSSSHLFTK